MECSNSINYSDKDREGEGERKREGELIAVAVGREPTKDISVSNIVAAKVTKEADYVQRSKKEATQHPFGVGFICKLAQWK